MNTATGRRLEPPAILQRAKELTTAPLREAVETLPKEIRQVVGYHLGWVDAQGRPEARGGKAVRPALAVLSAEAAGAPAVVGIPGGVALELIHNFSLLHDDVMDGDRERRHRPTVWALWGVGEAIIVGDALMALALRVLIDLDEPAALAAGRRLLADAAAMIAGQVEDAALETRKDVTIQECREMEAKKTGALLACGSCIGAILAGAPSEMVDGLAQYGLHLGLAFQAKDDLLGIWGLPENTGKPIWSDVRQKKNSLPIAAALSSGLPGCDELHELLARDGLSEAELGRAASLIEACGGRDHAEADARNELGAALAALDGIAIEPGARDELRGLARFLGERDY